MSKVSRMVTATILSMSLLTVMAAAAIAPAMGIIKQHFNEAPDMTVQLIISLPALFIILTNLCFLPISRVLRTRTIAIIGLLIYVLAGSGCFFIDNLPLILVMRALLGVSVGLIMPLSTGLLAYYFPPEEQAKMMGLSAAMNQMGGVVGTLMAGILGSIDWNYAFLVYLFGLIALLMILRWLPNEQLGSSNKRGKAFEPRQLLKFHPSVFGMLLLTIVFFVFPTNFAMISSRKLGFDTATITLLMVALDLLAFFVGLVFGRLMHTFRNSIKYFPPLALILGYALYAAADGFTLVLIGSAFIGLGNGIGVPYLLTIGSIKGGKNSATTVMPLLSASLYLGQFISPLIILSSSEFLFGTDDLVGPYKVAVLISVIYLVQVWSTRHFQSLPPAE
ncbi:MAG: MFS transporter [Bacteroides sp.]|nr:MFS transporter [Bacteroides sp.]